MHPPWRSCANTNPTPLRYAQTLLGHTDVQRCANTHSVHVHTVQTNMHESSLRFQTYSHVCEHRWQTGALGHMQGKH